MYKPHKSKKVGFGQEEVTHSVIIHPNLEPGVIDNAMIVQATLAHGPKEEAGRLFAKEGVRLHKITNIRLEFQKILRIDHLWMLTSLTKLSLAHNLIEKIEKLEQLTNLNELDLSFNKIEKIENIEKLVNLEVFTLFHNKIKKLENMEKLENLLVFSIGDNLIEDYKEMSYLRQFRKLRTVSVKGNPCCDDSMAYDFFKAALFRVTYIDYKIVTEEERERGRHLVRALIRKLDEADEIEEKKRRAREEYNEQSKLHKLYFVEYLNGAELFNLMFEKDPDGSLLLTFGGDLLPYYEQYKEVYMQTMADLVEFAKDAYAVREADIKIFRELVDNALEESVEKSKAVVAEYKQKQQPLKDQLNDLVNKFNSKQVILQEIEVTVSDLTDHFNENLYELWRKLMELEMQLFEQCEESRTQFSVNMTDRITKLLEITRNAFVSWREHDATWSVTQFQTLSKHLGNQSLLGDASRELVEVMMDRDKIMNAVAQSSDNHMRYIDWREDIITSHSTDWREDLVKNTNDNEIKRNRDRIMEINYYIDNQRIEWADLQMALHEAIDPEAAALLAQEY